MKRKPREAVYNELVREATDGLVSNADQYYFMERLEQRRISTFRSIRFTFFVGLIIFLVFDIDEKLVNLLGLPQAASYGMMALVVVIAIAIQRLLKRWFEEPHLRRHLAHLLLVREIRPHFCLLCRYSLRGSDSPRCPECGAKLRLIESVPVNADDGQDT